MAWSAALPPVIATVGKSSLQPVVPTVIVQVKTATGAHHRSGIRWKRTVLEHLTYAKGALQLVPGRIARIVINAPARKNAISRSMWAAIPLICDQIAQDDANRVVVLTASADGSGVFSAGADISGFDEVYASPESTQAYNDAMRLAPARLYSLPRPVIALIAWACVGGGCGPALAADLRFATPGARFAITPARLGLAYSPADTAQLVEKVGSAKAKTGFSPVVSWARRRRCRGA